MRWNDVKRWRDALRSDVASAPSVNLSTVGLVGAIEACLSALDDEALDCAAATGGTPWDSAAFVAARTVTTAPVEWCAVLLGRGTSVVLKTPAGEPGLAPWLCAHAARLGLPLSWTSDRQAIQRAEVVYVMGADATVQEVQGSVPATTTVVGFGHRFSVVWWARDAPVQATAEAVAMDLALHDTRGCMSPAVVLTEAALDVVVPAMARAMARAEAVLPRGPCSDAELAQMRSRGALAQVLGKKVAGDAWSVWTLPGSHAQPTVLPRCAQVVAVPDLEAAVAWTRPWKAHLSTVGTTSMREAGRWAQAGAGRVCRVGEMQRPPLDRPHDGVDLLTATCRPEEGGDSETA
jgi:hypothetical protein